MRPVSYVPAVIPEPVNIYTDDEVIESTRKAWFIIKLLASPVCPEIVTVSPTNNVIGSANVTVADVDEEDALDRIPYVGVQSVGSLLIDMSQPGFTSEPLLKK